MPVGQAMCAVKQIIYPLVLDVCLIVLVCALTAHLLSRPQQPIEPQNGRRVNGHC